MHDVHLALLRARTLRLRFVWSQIFSHPHHGIFSDTNSTAAPKSGGSSGFAGIFKSFSWRLRQTCAVDSASSRDRVRFRSNRPLKCERAWLLCFGQRKVGGRSQHKGRRCQRSRESCRWRNLQCLRHARTTVSTKPRSFAGGDEPDAAISYGKFKRLA